MVLLESRRVLNTGQRAPDFDLLGTDGKNHSLSDYSSRDGLLVVFMCNHCPYVKAKTGALNEIYRAYGGRIGMVGINSNDSASYPEDSYDNMVRNAAQNGFGFDYLTDPDQTVAKRYGAMCTPDPFLFDGDLNLIFHGRLDDGHGPNGTVAEKTMMRNIGLMLDGAPIPKDFEPSVGCSIKWKEN